MDKVFIPRRHLIIMTKTHKSSKWIDSELVEVEDIKQFRGAIFDLSTTDKSLLESIGWVDISKKLYCKIVLEIGDTINVKDKLYTVANAREYDEHADLRIYYLKRVGKSG